MRWSRSVAVLKDRVSGPELDPMIALLMHTAWSLPTVIADFEGHHVVPAVTMDLVVWPMPPTPADEEPDQVLGVISVGAEYWDRKPRCVE